MLYWTEDVQPTNSISHIFYDMNKSFIKAVQKL